jgi:CHAT domain-containing protein/Tfp pilus assembly protein PilF
MRRLCLGVVLLLSAGIAQPPTPIDPKYAPLAQQLFTAAEQDRAALIAAHPDLAEPKLVSTMNEIAGRFYDRGDFEPALPMYQTVLAVAVQLHDQRGEGKAEHNIGITLSQLYRNEEALKHFDRAVALYDASGASTDKVSTLNAIGIRFHHTGDLNTAEPYLVRALNEAEKDHYDIGVAQSALNLGNLYRDTGRYRDAVRYLMRSLEIVSAKPGFERYQAMALNNIGGTYFEEHEFDLAISYHLKALDLKEKAHAPDFEIANSLNNLALDYQTKEEPEKALTYYARTLKLSEGASVLKTRVLALFNYGTLLHHLGRSAEAAVRLNEALEMAGRIGDPSVEFQVRVEMATIAVEEHRYEDAVRDGAAAADYARRENFPRVLVRADDVLGVALQSLGRKAEAEAALEEAIKTVERLRAELPGERQALANFMSEEVIPYQHMILAQADNGHPELALAYSERSKARTLLDVLQSGGATVTKSMTVAERAREQQLAARVNLIQEQMAQESRRDVPNRRNLTALGTSLETARIEHRSFELELYAAHPELKVQRVAFDPFSPTDLAAGVPDTQTAMLEYAITDGSAFLFVVTKEASGPVFRHYRIAAEKDALARDVLRFREQIAGRDLGYRRLGAALYQKLIEPAREQLRGKSTLIVVPDGVLWQLPFQALESRANRHLLEDYAIFYTPSLSVLHEMTKLHLSRQIPQPKLMAVEATLAADAKREIDGLRQVYGPGNIMVLSGAEADHDRIQEEAPKYEVLHISAHGVFQDRNPMESYLVLSKAGKLEAGLLPAREMMNLNLHADMVVLAGCETGRGESGSGEGLIGMSWALFIAGSPATVASQWKVDAASTSDFMLAFHRRLRDSSKARDNSKAKALQAAALSVMRNPQYRHPFYWSGFVLLGEGK